MDGDSTGGTTIAVVAKDGRTHLKPRLNIPFCSVQKQGIILRPLFIRSPGVSIKR